MRLPSGPRKFNSPLIYLVFIALGVLSGLSDIEILHTGGLLISDIFIKIFKCISLPIIALSIIVTLSQHSGENSFHKIWKRTILYTVSTTIVAASVACGLYFIIAPANVTPGINQPTYSLSEQTSYSQHLLNLIPSNVFSPFLENQVMGVLLISIIVGISIRYVRDDEARAAISNLFKGAHGVLLVITSWVVAIIPIALYGFITTAVLQLKEGMDIKGLGAYLAIIVLANLVQGFVVLPIWLTINKIKPFATMRGMLPALSLAFFSKSSAGTLPVTIETAEQNLRINPKVSRFVFPLCTTINMNGCAAFIFTTVIYLLQNNGAPITGGTMVTWIIIATIAAVGNAGVPMGCFFLSASLLASMNVPLTLLGLILPFYSILDMIETALNVWSDSCVARVVDRDTFALEHNPLPSQAVR